MSILKYEGRCPRSLIEMYDYLTDTSKTDISGIFGLGVNPSYAVTEMTFVQKVYYMDEITRPYVQVIFAFDQYLCLNIQLLKQICLEIGQCLVLDKRQVFGAIHYKNTDKIHCHYMINYVGIDGNLYRQGYSVIYYKDRVNNVLSKYGLTPIEYYGRENHINTG